jgi:hypothetical protein
MTENPGSPIESGMTGREVGDDGIGMTGRAGMTGESGTIRPRNYGVTFQIF